MPEAACTSTQLHTQVGPDNFAAYWNASQAISGIQLAIGANSPYLLGKELWRETRIPLFEQATDTRSEELKEQGVRPRVWFGERWITSIFDLFEENVRYFPALLPITDEEDPLAVLEEGGTPAIIGSIRAGLVFQLKEAVGVDVIRAREEDFIHRAIESWSANPNVRILGNKKSWRLSIVSFVVAHGDGALHHNFVVALLNDLFGIQARGGCSCAGPYGHRLLGIDEQTSKRFQCAIVGGMEGIKPGWVRVNFNYFISETVFRFLLDAVHFVATNGHKLLPHYRFDLATGQWRPRRARPAPAMRLHDLSYASGKLEYHAAHATAPESALAAYLAEAERIVADAEVEFRATNDAIDEPLPEDAERLRWFPLPSEILAELQGRESLTHSSFALGGARTR